MSEGENDAVEVDGPKSPVSRVHGQMREVVLDVARHPARHFFLSHHSKTHKSPSVICAESSPTQYPNCVATIPINSGAASSFKRASAI